MKGEVQLEPPGEQIPRDSDPLLENQANSPTGSSSEINSEDIEAGSVPCCRICLECDVEPGEYCPLFLFDGFSICLCQSCLVASF